MKIIEFLKGKKKDEIQINILSNTLKKKEKKYLKELILLYISKGKTKDEIKELLKKKFNTRFVGVYNSGYKNRLDIVI